MKKYLLLLLVITLIIIQKNHAQTPVAYYPFTGNANDAAGTNNGTVNGATLSTDRFGNANSAYSFDGVDDNISINNSATFNFPNSLTISLWVKYNGAGTAGKSIWSLISKNFNGNGNEDQFHLWVNATDKSTGGRFGTGPDLVGFGGLPAIDNGSWHQIHVVFDNPNNVINHYLDGVLISTAANTANVFNNGSAIRIGYWEAFNNFFNGAIDEVKIYNTALTAAQVQNEYTSSAPVPAIYSSTFGNSVKMNGVNDNIAVPHSAAMQPGMFVTAECWAKSNTATWNDFGFLVNKENAFMIHPRQGVKTINFYAYNSTGQASTEFTPGASFDITQWHHYAGTYNGTTGQLNCYIDGVLVAQAVLAGGGSIRVNSNALFIGVDPCCPNRFFNGTLDEVRLWHTTRTQAEIVANMNQQLTGTEAGLVGYWDMNRNGQGAGLTVDNKCVATGVALNGTTVGTASTPIFAPGVTQQKPGSGNAISFDAANDYLEIVNGGGLNGLQSGSIEMWVKWNGNQPSSPSPVTGAIIGRQFDGVFSNQVIGLNGVNPNTNQIVWRAYQSGGIPTITSSVAPGVGWNHLCVTYASGDHKMFLNGLLVGTGTETGGIGTATIPLTLGAWINSGSSFGNSSLDEVRIWNTTLTQAQIRDRMCRKINASDALYSNLVAYYNFDESTGNTAFDGTANANNGTLANSPTRVTSGAAIGNASSHDYVNATKTANLTHPTGESFTVTSTSGNPDGIHVYRVDEKPNNLTGTQGVGSNNKYFGVFQAGGTTPQYTAVYNYNGNPGVSATNENSLALFKRTDNATASWSNGSATLNTIAKTLALSGESTEYILGSIGTPLPLNLLSFTGNKQNNDALLQWKTANEVNVSRFEVQRSTDGVNFITIGTATAGQNEYSHTDIGIFNSNPTVFYRLKTIDVDGRFNQSAVVRLKTNAGNQISIFPNPTTDRIIIAGLKNTGVLKIVDINGRLIQQQKVTSQSASLDVSTLAAGMYNLRYESGEIMQVQKFIKH